jgi:prepilin-type N-terminal cleavage/methylation domain-containing protein
MPSASRHSTASTAAYRQRRGLSLLEVMLAIAILGGALATLGQLVRIGARSSVAVRDLTQGQLLCENKLAEIAAGVVPPEPVSREPAEETGEWLLSVDVQPVDDLGLLGVTVLVEQDPEQISRPSSVQLTRWMVDPAVDQAAAEEQAARDQAAAEAAAADKTAAGQTGTQGANGSGSGNQQGGGNGQGGGQGGGGQGNGGQGGPGGGGAQNPGDPQIPGLPGGLPPNLPGGFPPNVPGQGGNQPNPGKGGGRGNRPDNGQNQRPPRGGGGNGQRRGR